MYSSYLFAAVFFTIYILLLSIKLTRFLGAGPELHGLEKHKTALLLALFGAIIITMPFHIIESMASFSPVLFFTIILVLIMIVVVASVKEYLRKEKIKRS